MKISRDIISLCVVLALGVVATSLGDVKIFLPQLIKGAALTFELTAVTFVLAVLGAFSAALALMSPIFLVRWLSLIYVELFRGTSLLVQLFWIFYVLPNFGLVLSPMTAAVLALSLNYAAYGAEIVRGAIQSIPDGQHDAIKALNIGRWRAMREVILPQAVIAMIPPLGNLAVDLMKSTALVSAVALYDLTFAAYQMNTALGETLQIFGVTMLIYYAGSQCVRLLTGLLELKFARGLSRGRGL